MRYRPVIRSDVCISNTCFTLPDLHEDMGEIYRTIGREARIEKTIEKSVFIASAFRVSTREEIDLRIGEMRLEFKDATHCVPAWILGEDSRMEWTSDDREPSGTAGMPVLSAIKGRNLTYTLITVVRYYGGIKLGTGGLVRAYGGAATDVLDQAGEVAVSSLVCQNFTCDYKVYNKISAIERPELLSIENPEYTEKVRAQAVFDREDREEVIRLLNDISAGQVNFQGSQEILREVKK
jgi:uncharacterized YigZ family protein